MVSPKFCSKIIFAILSIILIICCIDQVYMMHKYNNISIETLVLTMLFTGLSVYFAFFRRN